MLAWNSTSELEDFVAGGEAVGLGGAFGDDLVRFFFAMTSLYTDVHLGLCALALF